MPAARKWKVWTATDQQKPETISADKVTIEGGALVFRNGDRILLAVAPRAWARCEEENA